MLSEFIDICQREAYVKPTVYQGLYNLIDRRHEGPVFDLVRKHNMQFVAHSPHASGFPHGALTTGRVEGTRFEEGNVMSLMPVDTTPRSIMTPSVSLTGLLSLMA
jgi:aflatoxin B1 aldehyde reductase